MVAPAVGFVVVVDGGISVVVRLRAVELAADVAVVDVDVGDVAVDDD